MLDVRSAMRRTAAFNRDRIAVKSLGREITFGESWDRGVRLANALLGMGLTAGDRVAVLEDNCIEAADFYVGSVAANLVRVPLEECRVRLGSYKKPTRVEFRTEPLPRSPVGKIQRKVLREPYWSGQGRRVGGS